MTPGSGGWGYRSLLRLLPAWFREAHGREMEDLFGEDLARRRSQGLLRQAGGWAAAVLDVATTALRLRWTGRPRPGAPSGRGRPHWMESTLQDFRHGIRSLVRTPGHTLVSVAVLGLGIGTVTALFTVVDTALLRAPPGVLDPGTLVGIHTSNAAGPRYGMSSYLDFLDFRTRTPGLADAALITPGVVNLAGDDGSSSSLMGEFVSAGYFPMLGVSPARGRGFTADEGDPRGGAAVAVLGHGLWTRRFGGDPGVVGRTIRLSGQTVTVVGIAPEGFRGSLPVVSTEVWLPLSTQALLQEADIFQRRGRRSSLIRGRLVDGAAAATVEERLNILAVRLHEADPDAWTDLAGGVRQVSVVTDTRVPPALRAQVWGLAGLLGAAALLVLLIACANVANLTLARALGRSREMAVRRSLGAGPGRIVRHHLAESALVGLAGGVLGVGLAELAVRQAGELPPVAGMHLSVEMGVDGRVFLFALVTTVVTALLASLLPALRSTRRQPASALREGPSVLGNRSGRLQDALVGGQVAVSLILLVGAGLLLRSVHEALGLDPGFRVEGLVAAAVDLAPEGYSARDAVLFFEGIQQRIDARPDVLGSALTHALPMTPTAGGRNGATVPGHETSPDEAVGFPFFHVGPGFASVLGMEVLSGREFTAADGEDGPPGILVNEAFARHFWPGGKALGETVIWGGREEATVLGVLADAAYQTPGEAPQPAWFVPLDRHPMTQVTLAVRTTPGASEHILAALRDEIRTADPRLVGLVTLQTMEEIVAFTLLPRRVAAGALSLAGGAGLLLAALGLYGVLSFVVAQRTREVGLRMALGARRADVMRMVVGRGMRTVMVGIVAGLGTAALLTHFLTAFLFRVHPLDPVVFLSVGAGGLAVAVLAAWVPARRATGVDPMRALGAE